MNTPATPSPLLDNQPASRNVHATVEELARTSVRTLFKDMFNLDMINDEPFPLADEDAGQIVSSVGFIGDITGIIHLYTGISFAKTIASRMVGHDEDEVESDDIINDAIAELGNVVVGAVKYRLCDLGWNCTLTVPSVLRGHHLRMECGATAVRTTMAFRAGEHRMIAEIMLTVPNKPKTLKLLTVDDSKTVRLAVAKAFKRFDCVVIEAINGADGLEAAAREKPDLILLDYTMPVLDGFETMSRLVADPALKSIPVVMLTAEGGRETMVRMARLGVRDYLVKPFKEEVVIERIGRIVTLAPKTAASAPNERPAATSSQFANKDF